ncbi:MAG: N-acetylmuramoyl-L-alanine amidase [Pseudomonadota bacterium]
MKCIVNHHTGGTYSPNHIDLESYHGLVDGDGNHIMGNKPYDANRTVNGKLPDDYVRHAGGFNSDAIGLAACGMKDAQEYDPAGTTQYPITHQQFDELAKWNAELCITFGIPVENCFLHSEIQPRFRAGIYKWDINYVEGLGHMYWQDAAGEFRRLVEKHRDRLTRKPTFWEKLSAWWSSLWA